MTGPSGCQAAAVWEALPCRGASLAGGKLGIGPLLFVWRSHCREIMQSPFAINACTARPLKAKYERCCPVKQQELRRVQRCLTSATSQHVCAPSSMQAAHGYATLCTTPFGSQTTAATGAICSTISKLSWGGGCGIAQRARLATLQPRLSSPTVCQQIACGAPEHCVWRLPRPIPKEGQERKHDRPGPLVCGRRAAVPVLYRSGAEPEAGWALGAGGREALPLPLPPPLPASRRHTCMPTHLGPAVQASHAALLFLPPVGVITMKSASLLSPCCTPGPRRQDLVQLHTGKGDFLHERANEAARPQGRQCGEVRRGKAARRLAGGVPSRAHQLSRAPFVARLMPLDGHAAGAPSR